AAWLNSGQSQALDLTWLIHPGTVTSSLITGILGLQPQPTVAEAAGWLVYAIPMLVFVLWPQRRRIARSGAFAASAIALGGIGVVLAACGSSGSSTSGVGASASNGGPQIVKVTLTDAGCKPDVASINAGPTTFEITNAGSSKNTEFELVDK